MENCLTKNKDINVVYTINEPAAVGAYGALQQGGSPEGVLIVSVDGGCDGVEQVKKGVIGATSQQYPVKMAELGVEAIKKIADGGDPPKNTEGLDFYDTGVALVTDKPADGRGRRSTPPRARSSAGAEPPDLTATSPSPPQRRGPGGHPVRPGHACTTARRKP